MEFHDILHGLMRFSDENLTKLLADLINSPEIHRLRNMRQMNFDVPLIQELGRSRRLPHSIGVTYLAIELAHKSQLNLNDTKALLAAALLHDAAIPPYGHLVESELKYLDSDFSHEENLAKIIRGTLGSKDTYQHIVRNKELKLTPILQKHGVDIESVIDIVCPRKGAVSPISADIDIDNIDNVHRMAAMLGWDGAKENIKAIRSSMRLNGLNGLVFSQEAIEPLHKWLEFRERIYTMIIAHPECIPYNALQADLVRLAVGEGIITPANWYMTEPEFEEKLRSKNSSTEALGWQLISGCEYQFVDYVWLKNFSTTKKLKNKDIVAHLNKAVPGFVKDSGYFVWNEKGLISRKIKATLVDSKVVQIGKNSTSCMIALVRKSSGQVRFTRVQSLKWRQDVIRSFIELFETDIFDFDFPETYTGSFYSQTDELQFEYK
ncbi:HD domain-containing protein [Pseudomonas putida]|uniref:HD domain-containing protein n=1 Tax=Pseudomonas putida TaxID=303 RepID=UPI001A9080F1|nr:HD domain-containing protein [Pseudomonas putida]MBO0368514.1 HD domain-containing protein [Pseudomonas putida]